MRSACVVIQKVATRRSKQTGQHRQHLINTKLTTCSCAPLTWFHQQGESESAEQRGAPSEPSYRHPQKQVVDDLWAYRIDAALFFQLTVPVFPSSSHMSPSYTQVWHMPYSFRDLGIFMSLNLSAASWMCCHREKKWKLAGGFGES